MGLSRRRFTREFKLAAVQRLEQGNAIAEVARAMEVNPNVLHRWRKDSGKGRAMRFPVRGSDAGRKGGLQSSSARSGSKRWRSIF